MKGRPEGQMGEKRERKGRGREKETMTFENKRIRMEK